MKKTKKVQVVKDLGQVVLQNKALQKKPLTDHQQAFLQGGKAAGEFYKGLQPMLRHLPVQGVVAHFMELFMKLQKDSKRPIAGLLKTSNGMGLFKGLDCNENAKLSKVLSADFTVDKASGQIDFTAFEPKKHLVYPPSTASVCLQAGVLAIDFDKPGSASMGRSRAIHLGIDAAAQKVSLPLQTLPASKGCRFFLLQILFLDQVAQNDLLTDNYLHSLHPSFNVLSVVGVA